MKVLHIDNEENGANLMNIERLANLETITSIEEALVKKGEKAHSFDLVFLSERIWCQDPTEVIKRVKNTLLMEDGQVMAILETESAYKADKLFLAGAYDYVLDPISESKLLFKMKQLGLQRKSIEREKELLTATQHLEKANEQLKSLTPLKGVYNRRFLYFLISKIDSCAPFSEKKVSLLMADIDAFKAFKDTYGHLKGDQCLQLAAKSIDESGKKVNGLTARYGGEEFIMVIENRDEKQVIELAEEIRPKSHH
ncbi:diguanylate cyclase [Metabacillus sp. RGM 3146]|uniref:diguanylate cyclase n=1 Tax=Metabacillus sp. RGM 3146 TaxID=3401092 RepID=UPI003B9D44C9